MGLLPEKGCELIEGDVIGSLPSKDDHSLVVTRLFELFSRVRGFLLLLSHFSLYVSNDTLPEPDFAVLKTPTPTLTPGGYVQTRDVELLIEVSDATLARDLSAKALLYARAGIAEYWVIDVTGRRLLIHGDPQMGEYTQVTEYAENEIAAPLFAPAEGFMVSDILP